MLLLTYFWPEMIRPLQLRFLASESRGRTQIGRFAIVNLLKDLVRFDVDFDFGTTVFLEKVMESFRSKNMINISTRPV